MLDTLALEPQRELQVSFKAFPVHLELELTVVGSPNSELLQWSATAAFRR